MTIKVPEYTRALRLAQAASNPPRKAYELLLAADRKGDARASYALATWYLFGSPFTTVNKKNAVRFLKRAAKGGEASAAFDLAIAYEKGDGVKRSTKLAFDSYVHAALLGDSQSFHEVGRMYFHGIGTPRNRSLANHWLAKARSLGIKK